jgi:hypothetical protein
VGVLVIGMHRSGTSALSGLLEGLGLDAGAPDGLMASDAGNPEGYYEQRSIVGLSDEILAAYGGRWDSPPLLARGWDTELSAEHFVQKIRNLVALSFTGPRYVLKDPRISLLLPIWRQALLDRTCAVVVVRDPAEVAWSLALRDGMPSLTGLALWSAYNRTLLDGLSGLPVHVCSYAELLERPDEVIADIVASLRDWGEAPGSVDLESAVSRVRPGLRRDTMPARERELSSPPPEITALHKVLLDARGRHDRCDLQDLPAPGWWEAPLLEERRTILQRTTQTVNEYVSANQALFHENAAQRAHGEELARELAATAKELARLRAMWPLRVARALARVVRR